MTRTNKAARCPACLKTLDAATHPAGGRTPKPGDLSVCVYCSLPLVFCDDLSVRTMRTDEYRALPASLRWQLDILTRVAHTVSAKRNEKDEAE